VLLIVLAPVMALVALATRWSSEGPALFRQERVGQGGRAFSLYKFRTMVANAEALTGPTLSSGHDDPRLTPLGKFLRRSRLDELPQLWNVLIGDMSLIGPRPERPCFVEQFGQAQPLYVERHRVRPGITGLAQVRAGYHTDARDKLRYDLLYVSHPSPWLDLEILLRTIGVMFKLCG
jgi:lipopolysaccharide/colanic/teichoic acid biosynthesis glycosyltransferase